MGVSFARTCKVAGTRVRPLLTDDYGGMLDALRAGDYRLAMERADSVLAALTAGM